ncbi:DUF4340 domain-containing protein [Marinicella meishanensis]|uniref:DUF4340 domain-containing protein n=1 Tax=Marinicella meishanensis TaxID=2873263 RepID=UPI001CBEF124|nr:DUF4340 domain-containing protein [Marinicella sp. NBU2979]
MLSNMKVLLIILLLVATGAFWVLRDGSSTAPSTALLPDWQASDDPITAIKQVVLEQGGERIELQRQGQRWVLNGGFYANIDPLFMLLQSFKNAAIVEAKTANPDNHAQVFLSTSDLKVSLHDQNGLMQAIHVGKVTTAGLTFVRFAEADQTYTVSGLERITFNLDSWQLKTVLDVPAEQIKSVLISPEDGEAVHIERADVASPWELLNLPAGQEVHANAAFDSLAGGLTRLMIDAAEPVDLTDKTTLLSATYGMFGGGEITLVVQQAADEQHWLQVVSAQHPEYAEWMMQIAPYKFTALNQQLSDFIQPVTAAEAAATTESEDDPVDPVIE